MKRRPSRRGRRRQSSWQRSTFAGAGTRHVTTARYRPTHIPRVNKSNYGAASAKRRIFGKELIL
jgi:hypothetical protein